MTERAFRGGADQAPAGCLWMPLEVHPVAVRVDVGFPGVQLQRPRCSSLLPAYLLLQQVDKRVFRHVNDIRVLPVYRITRVLYIQHHCLLFADLCKAVTLHGGEAAGLEALPQVPGGKRQRPAGMLFLAAAEQVRRITDLRLDLLLAVAEVVIRDQCHDDATVIAAHQLEGVTVVVALVRVTPAHAIPALPGRGCIEMRQTDLGLAQFRQVRCENDAAAVPGPVIDIEGGVILRQVRVTGIAEDRLDKIQVGHQASGGEYADLHVFRRQHARHFRAHRGTHQQRCPDSGAILLGSRDRQTQQVFRRIQRRADQAGKHACRHLALVVRHRESAGGDMEHAAGRTPVVPRVVQHALQQPVGIDIGGVEIRLFQRQ